MNWIDQQSSIVGSHEYGTLISLAWADPAFQKRLLDHPREAISEALGVKLNPNFKVRAVQDEPGTYTLVIPASPVPPGKKSGATQVAADACNTVNILFTLGCTGSC
jgi:hypothetical protein